MDDLPMSKEESYVERRQLFKNIWDTAMQLDDKEDILNKHKVIKTLRLSEVDKCPVGKTKKQRIKNLRHVCRKILGFCDKQDAEDKLYEQVAAAGQTVSMALDLEPNKSNAVVKQQAKEAPKVKSMITRKVTGGFVTASEAKNLLKAPLARLKTSTPTSPLQVTVHKPLKRKTQPVMIRKSPEQIKTVKPSKIINDESGEPVTRRKVVKKKRVKRKKKSNVDNTSPGKATSPRNLYNGIVK